MGEGAIGDEDVGARANGESDDGAVFGVERSENWFEVGERETEEEDGADEGKAERAGRREMMMMMREKEGLDEGGERERDDDDEEDDEPSRHG